MHSDERKEQLSQQARARVASGEHNETADRFIAGAKLATQKRYNKGDEDLQDLSYEDLFVEPVVRPLGGNQFVAGGDLWTESD